MRCRNCDYPLWNLPSRACPECGQPFQPSEYEFVRSAVEFRCPHCGKGYYGTSESGHLVPDSFECVLCRSPIVMNEMVLSPALGVDESQTALIRNPWLARRRTGFFRSLMQTINMSLTKPGRLLCATPAGRSAGGAWDFVGTILLGLFIVFLVEYAVFAATGAGVLIAVGMCGPGFPVALIPLVWFLVLYLWGAAAHLLLLFSGPAKHNISRTFEAMCYGSGPLALSIVPCVGQFAVIWSIVSSAAAFKEAQEVTGGRASLCVVTPPVVALVLAMALWMGASWWAVAWFGRPSSSAPMWTPPPTLNATQSAAAGARASTFAAALLAFARENEGVGPRHGLELLDSAAVSPEDFCESDVQLAVHWGQTLQNFNSMPPRLRQEVIADARAMITPATVAHRIGEVVLTHHGIELFNCDRGLWLFIICEEPGGAGRQVDPIWIGRADGSVDSVDRGDLTNALVEQNALRAEHDLQPLSDPLGIRADRPADAGQN